MKTLIKKWAKDLNRHLSEEDPQMISKHMKLCSTFYVTMEMKIKTAMRYQCTPIRMDEIQNSDHTKCWGGSEALGTFIYCWWGVE